MTALGLVVWLGRTSAVGMYPLGASAEGVMDLSGNVWEWCSDEVEGRESRELRGGAWDVYSDYARVDYRVGNHLVDRYNYVGFRVVCSSPIR